MGLPMPPRTLGFSRRQAYVLIRRARQGTGLVTNVAPGRPGGGKSRKAQKRRVPTRDSVGLPSAVLGPLKTIRRRKWQDASRALQSAGGVPPAVIAPLGKMQIDHTIIDLIEVRWTRPATGWPSVPDHRHRCVHPLHAGHRVHAGSPSAVSIDKRPLLEGLGVEMNWSMAGESRQLYLDNAIHSRETPHSRHFPTHTVIAAVRGLHLDEQAKALESNPI